MRLSSLKPSLAGNRLGQAAQPPLKPKKMLLGIVANNQWTPGIGDPSWMGWVTVLAYFVAALLCLGCASLRNDRAPKPLQQQHRWGWLSFALILVLLGINKQLDLQSLLTVIGRNLVRLEGWGDYKRVIQALFLLTLVASSIFVYGWAIARFRWFYRHYRLAFLGMAFLILFILARAASFHHFDWFIGVEILGMRINWILELGGIFCITLSAANLLKRAVTT